MKVQLIITYVPTNTVIYDEEASSDAGEEDYNDFIDMLKNPTVKTLDLKQIDGSNIVIREGVLKNCTLTVKKV